jgi:gluconate 2-dehydrogenase gamma chain
MHHERDSKHEKRRSFLKRVAALSGSASLAHAGASRGAAQRATPLPEQGAVAPIVGPAGYTCLSPDEAAFVEAVVNVMCPADEYTASGVDCGLAIYIDRQMSGGLGHGERLYRGAPWSSGNPQFGYQLPLTPEQFFKAGIEAAQTACTERFGKRFEALAAQDADRFLRDLAEGKVASNRMPLASWFNETLYPLFVQACFADPVYGGNQGKVFWKLVGYPGLPALHRRDMTAYRGKRFPGAANPKSIADFS